jgi:cardiolipin synthase
MNAAAHRVLNLLPAGGIPAHLFAIAGFLLAFSLVARLMSEKRAPANTFAWLLVIVLLPYVGVPLYLLIGGRKLRRIAVEKKRILPSLPDRFPDANAKKSWRPIATAVVAAGGLPPVAGNKVRLLATGEDEFAALEEQIRGARHCIHITTFILGRDETGRRIVGLLAERAREGVKVRLLLDAVGCLATRGRFVDPIRAAGGEVGRFMPVVPFTSRGSANLRNHRKIAIFDHARAIMGGRNLASEYMGRDPYPKRWRDLGALVEGPAAALLNEVFIADWCFATRQKPDVLHAEFSSQAVEPCGGSELQVVASGPDVPGDPLYEGIVSMIQEAENRVWIVTPYFIPDDVLLRSLIVKARAGRNVTLVVPAHSNHRIADLARRQYLGELRRAGGKLLFHTQGMLHAKAIIVDDQIALFGSPNFDVRSLFVNFEVGVLAHSTQDVAAISAWAEALMDRCVEPKVEANPRRKVFGNVAEDISRLLAPLL